MQYTPESINSFIRSRRSIFPAMYTDQPIDKAVIEALLENANWAPTHRLTEPWRFQVFHSEAARTRLSDYLSEWYREHTQAADFSEKKFEKTKRKPLQSACVLAICMQRDPEERVPEWEEIAAVSCAVQNLWLSAAAYGIGGYWSSPKSMLEADDFLQLKQGERCLGLFYMGYYEASGLTARRTPLQEKVVWY